MRNGVLMAGGHPVHRLVRRNGALPNPDVRPKSDGVPVMERYQDVAMQIHRIGLAPRGDRFIVGCVCGYATLTQTGLSTAAASIVAQQHVVDEAQKLHDKLEGTEDLA